MSGFALRGAAQCCRGATTKPLLTLPGIEVRSTAGLRLTAPRAGASWKSVQSRGYGGCGEIKRPAKLSARLPAVRLHPLPLKVGTRLSQMSLRCGDDDGTGKAGWPRITPMTFPTQPWEITP